MTRPRSGMAPEVVEPGQQYGILGCLLSVAVLACAVVGGVVWAMVSLW